MEAGVYKITIGDKFYYGKTVNLVARKRQHMSDLRNGVHKNSYMQNAYNKYGKVRYEVLARCNPEDIGKIEKELVDLGKQSPQCMNLAEPDGLGGFRHTAKSRRLMSERKKGKPFSEDHKQKIRDNNRKRCSRPCLLFTDSGLPLYFECAADAAKFFGVSNGAILHYLKGRYPWPTTSRSKLVGLRGSFLDDKD